MSTDFKKAFEEGMKNARSVQRRRDAFKVIAEELDRQISDATQGKVRIGLRQQTHRKNDTHLSPALRAIRGAYSQGDGDGRTVVMACLTHQVELNKANPGATEIELAEWTEGDEGQVKIGAGPHKLPDVTCYAAVDLEKALSDMLRHPDVAVSIRQLMDSGAPKAGVL